MPSGDPGARAASDTASLPPTLIVLTEGTYTITAVVGGPLHKAARRAMAVSDTFVVTVSRAQAAPLAPSPAGSEQRLGVAKTVRVKDGFRVKFIGGVNVTTRFSVKVDGRLKRTVTVRAGDIKVKTYAGQRRIRVRAVAGS